MSSLYVDMNDYGKAQQALENSLRIRKQSFHEDHLDVAETLHLLGLVLVNLGDRKNAFPCFRESLRIRKTVLGSGNC
jgi:tetratricopeptide (TPR) repeat protein